MWRTSLQLIEDCVADAPCVLRGNDPFTLVKNPAVAGRNLEFYRYDGRGIRGTDGELARCMASVTVEAVFEAVTQALA